MQPKVHIIGPSTNDLTEKEVKEIIDNGVVCIDTETKGLDANIDKLCLIQLYSNEKVYLLKYTLSTEYTNLKRLLLDSTVKKIFHHATFDLQFLMINLGIKNVENIVCTKVGAKILLDKGQSTSLKDILKNFLEVDIDKMMQISNWEEEILGNEQINYAINDVIYLNDLWEEMKVELIKRDRLIMTEKCYAFLPLSAYLRTQGIANIFEY
ncbi:MAG: ribonuclease D [Cellulosilyticaceae bacterium]